MNFKVEEVEILKVEGDKVNLRIKSSFDFARGLNIAFLEYTEEHVIQGGKIKSHTNTITKESAGKLQTAMANQAEKENVLTAMADSLSAGDLDATMALFTDDAVVKILFGNVLPPESYIGSEQVRFLMKDLVAMNFKIQIEILQVLGDIAVTMSKTWHDATIQLGIAPMEMVEIYPIEDGKIKGFISILTDESLAKLQAALAPK